jgi:putative Mg2+ transporter-C (MgtC) family protein
LASVFSLFGNWADMPVHLVRLLVAFILALPIGWNRESEDYNEGLRTFPLVAIASCGLVQTAISVLGPSAISQASVLQGLVTGVGFIGAGAIMRQGTLASGSATAASIWNVGIIGGAVGYGYFDIGVVLAIANIAVLRYLTRFKRKQEQEREKV